METFIRALGVAAVVLLMTTVWAVWENSFQGHTPVSRVANNNTDGKLHVLVTGGAGFIGSHASLALLDAGHSVTSVDNLSRGYAGAIDAVRKHAPKNMYSFVQLELGDLWAVHRFFEKHGPFDVVIHFAALAFVGESVADPLLYYRNITANTLNVLEAMSAGSPPSHRFIYSSTCATYGNPATMPITEATAQVPVSPYGSAKLSAEHIVSAWAQRPGMPGGSGRRRAAKLRYFNVIGADPAGRVGESPRPDLRRFQRISTACYETALGIQRELTGRGTDFDTEDGTAVRDYVHVTDLVRAHMLVMDELMRTPANDRSSGVGTQVENPLVLNVGTGVGSSVRQFFAACQAATGRPLPVRWAERRPGDSAAVYSDVSKIRRVTGFKAIHTNLTRSLQDGWRWRRQHPNGYGGLQ